MIQLTSTGFGSGLATVDLPISKSIVNRELILGFLGGAERPHFASDVPDDVLILSEAIYSESEVWDLGHAGTAMRFATALACLGDKPRILRGSSRMHERPIHLLVDALIELGADIEYLDKSGYPPLLIRPTEELGGAVSIQGNVSSQYISALLLIAPYLPNGIELTLIPPITSRPYVDLTLDAMRSKEVECNWEEDVIRIDQQSIPLFQTSKERDWSAAAFFYGLVAQGCPESIYFPGLVLASAQGDCELASIFNSLGVGTESYLDGVRIYSKNQTKTAFNADLQDHPDLAQAVAFTCAAIGKECRLTGLRTLRIKETDRIVAIEECLKKAGCVVKSGEDWIKVQGKAQSNENIQFDSYDDHRMAMAASILVPALKTLCIADEDVVSKSFPRFWEALVEIDTVRVTKI